jgi:hypothetical protein
MKTKKHLTKLAAFLFIMTVVHYAASAQQNYFWKKSGNLGTNPAINYIGTKDSTDLILRTNALQRMTVKANGNTGIGVSSPVQKLDVSGNINIGSGYSLYMGGLKFLSTPGSGNMYIGYHTAENKGGYQCTIIGVDAGLKNSGSNNTFCGHESGISNTSGTYNTFYGLATGYYNATGDGNSLFGQNVMWTNISGSWNCSFGFEAGNYTTTSYNSFYGTHAGLANKTGSKNTYIGYSADANGANYSNSSCFGYTSQLTASNQVRLGNSLVTSIGGFAGWSNISDGRFKKNIKENVPGLEFIKQLHPVTYTLNVTDIDAYLHKGQVVDMAGKKYQPSNEDIAAMKSKEQIVYTGFIAQDVEAITKKIDYDFSGVDAPKNDKDLYGLRYAEFVVPLVKAVQELSSQNDELKNQLADLQNQINQIKANTSASSNGSSIGFDNASKTSNAVAYPNPAKNSVTVNYTAAKNSQFLFEITDISGRILLHKNVNATQGVNHTTIDVSRFAKGSYFINIIRPDKTKESIQVSKE